MDDLGQAMSVRPDLLMLGGGNPAHIPEMEKVFRESMEDILRMPETYERCVGDYDGPRGNPAFLAALAELLTTQYGWSIGPENIALTNGSQSAFYVLFSLFAAILPTARSAKSSCRWRPNISVMPTSVLPRGNPSLLPSVPAWNFWTTDNSNIISIWTI
jgi:valine--pyruvate aminotransferase